MGVLASAWGGMGIESAGAAIGGEPVLQVVVLLQSKTRGVAAVGACSMSTLEPTMQGQVKLLLVTVYQQVQVQVQPPAHEPRLHP